MKNKNINQDVYDQYMDAAVALYMECYSEVLTDNIHAEMEEANNNDIIFPAELDKRCRELIKNESKRLRRKKFLCGLAKTLKYAAVFFVALLSAVSILFMTVEAFRVSIINYYIEQHNGHWEITGNQNTDPELSTGNFDISNPLADIIPAQYTPTVAEGSSLEELFAIYEDGSGNRIFFSSTPGDNIVGVDSEDAQFSQECEIGGCKAVLVQKESSIRIVWIDERASIIYTIIADNMAKPDAISIVENLIKKL